LTHYDVTRIDDVTGCRIGSHFITAAILRYI